MSQITMGNRFKCTECSYRSNSLPRFKAHQMKHKRREYVRWFYCADCPFKSKYKNCLGVHIFRHQVARKEDLYHCAHCSYKTKLKIYLKKHLLIHKREDKKIECAQCSRKLKSKETLKGHINTVHRLIPIKKPELKTCPHCPVRYRYPSQLQKHLECHISTFKCTLCSFTTKWSAGFETHMWTHTTRKFEDSFQCAQCRRIYRTKLFLQEHIFKAHRQFINSSQGGRQKVEENEDDTGLLLQCSICSLKCVDKYRLKRHQLVHTSPDEVSWFKCTECSFRTKHKHNLWRHNVELHNYRLLFDSGLNMHNAYLKRCRAGNELEWLFCADCTYKTKCKSSLTNHVLVHKSYDEVEIFQCTVCPYKSKSKRQVTRHLLIHKADNERKVYVCPKCPITYKTKRALKNHTYLEHTVQDKLPWFLCPHCSYRNKIKDNIRRHMIVHKTEDEVEIFKCSSCPYKTNRKSNFNTHLLIHKPEDEITWFKCSYCPFKTKYNNSIKYHLLTHQD